MVPIRSWNSGFKSSKCSICRIYGIQSGDTQNHSDFPELQSNPRDPAFVDHFASLVSSFDLDGLSEQAYLRDAASQAEAIFSLQAVLSSVLRSPSFSPAERMRMLKDTRASLAEQYRLRRDNLDRILSEPFRSLDGLTPLEYEIRRWDPIWEGSGGMASYSSGMEMIQYLVEHWTPLAHDADGQIDGSGDSSDGETLGTCAGLILIARNACLCRLNSTPPESALTEEDTTNILFQRISRLIWSKSANKENNMHGNGQTPSAVGAGDFKVSVAYSPVNVNSKVKGKSTARTHTSSLIVCDDDDVDFTALVSIDQFSSLLRDSTVATPPPETVLRETLATTPHGARPLSYSREHRHDNRRHHPYALSDSQNQPQLTEPARSSAPPSEPEHRGPAMSPRLLLVEFLAAQRAWTLAIGHDELELAIHGQGSSTKFNLDSQVSSNVDGNSGPEKTVHAEVRLVAPPDSRTPLEDEVVEHVFTFPTMIEAFSCSPDKASYLKSPNVVRLSPCFPSVHPRAASQSYAKVPVARFDDARLLHTGELLLELRVRIRSSPSELTNAYLGVNLAPDAESTTDDADAGISVWSALSVPPTSGSPSGAVSFASSDLISETPSTCMIDSSESSWVKVQ